MIKFISRIVFNVTLLLPILFSCLYLQNGNAAENKLHLMTFRGGGFAAIQGGGSSFTGEISWNPSYELSDKCGLIGDLGSILLNQTGAGVFLALEYEVLAYYHINPTWGAEIGGGAQSWFSNPNTHAGIVSANVTYNLENKLLNFIDQLYVGYSLAVFNPTTHEIKLGVQVSF